MTLRRRAAKRDLNEPFIIAALEAAGAKVMQLSVSGAPDLLVAYRQRFHLLEVKGPHGRLTDEQQAWHLDWAGKGPIAIVRSANDALEAIGSPLAVHEVG